MSALVDRGADDNVFPGGALHSNVMDPTLFVSLTSNIDLYPWANKRSCVTAPCTFNGGETNAVTEKHPPSLDSLPNECLLEIFKCLAGKKERSTSACVSKRWLLILSSFRPAELSVKRSTPVGSFGSEAIEKELPDFDTNEEVETYIEAHLTRSLDDEESTDIKLAAMAIGTGGRGGLKKLLIRGSHPTDGITDIGLSAIARHCPALRSLTMWKLPHISDMGLLEIVLGCPLLEKLNLCDCPLISDKGMLGVAQRCSNLKSLIIENCPWIGNEGLRAIGRCCGKLSTISLKDLPHVGDQGITDLVCSACSSLTNIKLHNLSIGDMSLAVIGYYGTSVTELTLIGLQNVREKGFWVMGNSLGLKKLKSIFITSCSGATDVGLLAVAIGCPSLKKLFLRKCCYLSDGGLKAFLGAAKQLENLQFEVCHQITFDGVLRSLLNCSEKLKVLAFVKCMGIKDVESWPTQLPRCLSLGSLTVCDCPGFTSCSVAFLARIFPHLQEIDLSGLYGVTDNGVLPFIAEGRTYLRKVNFRGCVNVTDAAVTALVVRHGLTLEILNLSGCKNITDKSLLELSTACQEMLDLDLSSCKITDYGVAILASSRQFSLQSLSLARCSILTQRSLPLLGNMGSPLVALNLQGCNRISAHGFAVLEKRMRWCDILF